MTRSRGVGSRPQSISSSSSYQAAYSAAGAAVYVHSRETGGWF
jgi:hypothetical protein